MSIIETGDCIRDRFNARVRVAGQDECWCWIGWIDPKGYGRIKINRKSVRSHRVAMTYHLGREIIPSEQVLHSCDNPRCCNPSHLRLGTNADNMRDVAERGRRHGDRNNNHTLSHEQASKIIRRANTGERHKDIAKDFQTTRQNVSAIVAGVRWPHLTKATLA